MHRVLRVFSNPGLSLTHRIRENVNYTWSAQVKMTQKRGVNLWKIQVSLNAMSRFGTPEQT